jgi:hypothetical protein
LFKEDEDAGSVLYEVLTAQGVTAEVVSLNIYYLASILK